jgi:hypothetical protein
MQQSGCIRDGFHFENTEFVKKNFELVILAIIFVSGIALTELDRLRGYECGAVDYLIKPIARLTLGDEHDGVSVALPGLVEMINAACNGCAESGHRHVARHAHSCAMKITRQAFCSDIKINCCLEAIAVTPSGVGQAARERRRSQRFAACLQARLWKENSSTRMPGGCSGFEIFR